MLCIDGSGQISSGDFVISLDSAPEDLVSMSTWARLRCRYLLPCCDCCSRHCVCKCFELGADLHPVSRFVDEKCVKEATRLCARRKREMRKSCPLDVIFCIIISRLMCFILVVLY